MPTVIERPSKRAPRSVDYETQTKPDQLEPKPYRVANDTLKSRIVVVSPYSQINAYLAAEIPKLIEGGYVNVVNRSETADVLEAERHAQTPLWVVDFRRLSFKKPHPKIMATARAQAVMSLMGRYVQERLHDPALEQVLEGNVSEHMLDHCIDRVEKDVRKYLADTLSAELSLVEAAVKVNEDAMRWRVAAFHGYRDWVAGKDIVYVSPNVKCLNDLVHAERYDERGDFMPDSVDVQSYVVKMSNDLYRIRQGQRGSLQLFNAAVRVTGSTPPAIPPSNQDKPLPDVPPWWNKKK